LVVPGTTSAQSSATLQQQTSFAAQYDTVNGWLPAPGNNELHYPLAEPTIAAGQVDGQTRLLVGANNSIGNFFNALQGNDDYRDTQQSLASVFGGLLPAGYVLTQPVVLRESFPSGFDRYVIAAVAKNYTTQQSRIVISASQYTGPVLGSQCLVSFDVNDSPDTSLFADAPRLGNSGNALLMTANLYSYSDSSFQYTKLWMFPKTSIYNDPSLGTCPGAPTINSLVLNMPNSDGSLPFSVIPARSFDSSPAAYMVNSLWDGGSSLTEWILDTTDPTVITGVYGPVSTNPYSTPPPAEQPGTSTPISMWGTRLFNAVYQPDSGLWTVNTTACTPSGDTTQRACLQFYQVDPAAVTVLQQGLVQWPGFHFYGPGIAANDEGDAVLVFNGSSTDSYVGIYYAGHYRTDPPNTLQTVWKVKDGEGCFLATYGPNSVGTHSDATIDPINDSLFWLHSGYAYGRDANCQNNDWATGVAAVQFVGGSAPNNAPTQSGKGNGNNGKKPPAGHLSHFGK
jgi:hypothetical protein